MKTSTTSCPIREGDLVGKRAPESVCARERSYTGATDDLIPLRERRRAPSIRTWKRAATHPCGGHAIAKQRLRRKQTWANRCRRG